MARLFKFALLGLLLYVPFIFAVNFGLILLMELPSLFPDRSGWTEVHAQVLDRTTGAPVRGARVIATSGVPLQFFVDHDEARTDANGRFVVRTVPDRTFTIKVRAPGYRSYQDFVFPGQAPAVFRVERS